MVVQRILDAIPEDWNARDWDRVLALVAPDHEFVDHRPASAGEIRGREGLGRYLKTLVDLAPDARYSFVQVHRSGPCGGVVQWRIEGSNEGGGPIELEGLLAAKVRGGLIVRSDQYAMDQIDEALVRYEEMARGD